ncbi:MAG: ABC transporter permease [Bacteroidota bacterium]
MVKGEAAAALNAPDKIVISEAMAKKYFGTEEALNKTLTIGSKDYTISGICRNTPQNSQLKFDFVTQFLNLGDYIKKNNGGRPTGSLIYC